MPTPETSSQQANQSRRRGEILRQLGLMDETDEREFDDIVELAAVMCGKSFSAMTLLDEKTQITKARLGVLGRRAIPVRESICQFAMQSPELMVVNDTLTDERFCVPAAADIRFYAGTRIVALDGTPIGALCVMDTEPSSLTELQMSSLEVLGRQLSNRIQLRERAQSMAEMVTERDRAREMFVTILNNVPAEIYLKDQEGRLLFYNRKVADRFAVNEGAWIGKTSRDLWDEATADTILRDDLAAIESGTPQEALLDLKEPDGRISHWKTTKAPCHDSYGATVLACCSVDMTEQVLREKHLRELSEELKEANRKLSSLALTDALTGLWNRRAFDSRLETAVMSAQRSKQPLAMMMLDVDHFKKTNDSFGHPYGDEVLRNLAAILNRSTRADDVACRFGGEEFAILMPGTDREGAMALGERIREAMHAFEWEKAPVTISMGISLFEHNHSSDDLVDNADAALYAAKKGGRDRYECYSSEAVTA